jgi:hypothetical protein
MGLDDKPAIEVCDGRELAINDSVARTKAPRAPGTSPRTKARRRHSESVPVMVACEHCTTPVRLWGQGFVTGRAYCSTPACQQARRRHEYARAKERAPRPACEQCGQPCPPVARRWCGAACRTRARRVREEITTTCFFCGVPVVMNGKAQRAHYPCCAGKVCRTEKARLHTKNQRAKRRNAWTNQSTPT